MKVIDKDLGWKNIKKQLLLADDAHVDVGYFGEKKSHEGEISIVGIAAVQEFGSPKRNIPSRPFLRTTFEEKNSIWQKRIIEGLEKVSTDAVKLSSALTAVGEFAASDVRRKITEIRTPPKSPVTIAREGAGFTNPLIWLGWMRNYCRARIVVSGKKHITKEG